MRLSRKICFQMVAVSLGIVTGILLAEGVLRLAVHFGAPSSLRPFAAFMRQAEGTTNSSPMFMASSDPALGYELRPNIRNNIVRINAAGFRGPDYPEAVPAGKVRLAVLGDSEAFGQLLTEENTLAGAMQAGLNRGTGQTYEVLNFGVPGFNSAQELRLLETKVLAYKPSAVLLYYVFNDPIISDRTFLVNRSPLNQLMLFCFVDWYFHRRVTVNDLGSRFGAALANKDPRVLVEYFKELHSSPLFETTKGLIRQMARQCRKQNCRFILVIAPEIYGIDAFRNYPYHDIHAKLKGLASADIQVIDPLSDLIALGKKPGDFWVTDDDCHKNEEATGAIAAAVLRAAKFKMH